MRFLTRAWHAGDLTDAEAEAAEEAYSSHRLAVLPQLPRSLRTFAETVNIHDGLVRQITLDRSAGLLRFALRCGDLPQGYFDLDLEYRGVDLERLDIPVLRVIAEDAKSEALYLEVDIVVPGRYVHRWLWWRFDREVDVQFTDLGFHCEPRRDREFAVLAHRFVDISAPAV